MRDDLDRSGRRIVDGDPTPRELESLARSLRSGQKVAHAEMGISLQTIKNHLDRLYRKLDVTSASEAAIELGWLKIPEDIG